MDGPESDLRSILKQPKRLALFAYLALARPRGYHRRDTLLSLFWPDLDTDHARAALRQSLYVLRRALPKGLFRRRGDEQLGLGFDDLWCDVFVFEEAAKGGRPAEALELYRGELLPGLHVPDASQEFDYWLEQERARLRELATQAAWQLADAAAGEGSAEGVRRWAKRAIDLTPLNEESVRRQIVLMDAVGDRAGAVAAYEEWVQRLQEELELEPTPETRALIERVRGREELRPGARASGPSDGDVSSADAPARAAPDGAGARAGAGRKPTVDARTRRLRRRLGSLGAVVVLLALAAVVWVLVSRRRIGAAAAGVDRVMVLPFSFRGSPDVGYLSDGMVHLLSVALDGTAFRAVDPHTVLRTTSGKDREWDPSTAAPLAARFGADYYVLGSILEAEGRLRITASLYARGRERPVAQATESGETPEALGVVDQLAVDLLTRRRGEPVSRVTKLAAITTSSLPALKSYLGGEQLLREGRFEEAIDAFEDAVLQDSLFALAYYRLSLAASWAFRPELSTQAAENAVRHSSRLPEHERMLLTAHEYFRRGYPLEAEALDRKLVALYPQDPEVWYKLGEVLLHFGPLHGRSIRESRQPFRRAAELDPLHPEVAYHLTQIAVLGDDSAAARSNLEAALSSAPDGRRAPQLRALRALLSGKSSEWSAALAELRSVDDFTVISATYNVAVYAGRPQQAVEVATILLEPTRPETTHLVGHLLLASLQASMGRIGVARRELRSAAALDPELADAQLAIILSLPGLPQDTAELVRLRQRLRQDRSISLPGCASVPWCIELPEPDLARLYGRGLVDLALGDRGDLGQVLDSLRQSPDSTGLAQDMAGRLQVGSTVTDGVPDPLAELGAIGAHVSEEQAVLSPFVSEPGRRYLEARLLEARGRDREALAWYASLDDYSVYDLPYASRALLDRARLREKLGETDTAAELCRRFLDRWSDADAALQPLVAEARARLRRLSAMRSSGE